MDRIIYKFDQTDHVSCDLMLFRPTLYSLKHREYCFFFNKIINRKLRISVFNKHVVLLDYVRRINEIKYYRINC